MNYIQKYQLGKSLETKLNPKNWGVKDYTDKGDFNTAYSSARQAGEKEFMWNNKRYSTDIPQSNRLNEYISDNVYPYGNWATSESDFKIDYDELKKLQYYDSGTYTTNKKLHRDDIKKITRNKEGESVYDLYSIKGRSSAPGQPKDLNASYDALSIFNNQPQKYNSFKDSKYKPSDSKDINSKYYSFNDKYEKQLEDDLFKYDNREFINSKENKKQVTGSIIAGASLKDYQYSKGKDDRGDYVAYYDINDYGNILDVIPNTNPFEIYGRIYYKDYNGQKKRMYYSDKELAELDIDKKNFDTLALQRELSNRGIKLPKSTKEDETFDGVWGDETKQALLDWQTKNVQKHQSGGTLSWKQKFNQRVYDAIDPTRDYPTLGEAISHAGAVAFGIKTPKEEDPLADAAWRKRLGLPYDEKLLPKIDENTVTLPENYLKTILADTTVLKDRTRINNSKAYINPIYKKIASVDQVYLDNLRDMYKNKKNIPVNALAAWKDRNIVKDDKLIPGSKAPLNVLENFRMELNEKGDSINITDIYDFNQFEPFVPGKPFKIKATIKNPHYK